MTALDFGRAKRATINALVLTKINLRIVVEMGGKGRQIQDATQVRGCAHWLQMLCSSTQTPKLQNDSMQFASQTAKGTAIVHKMGSGHRHAMVTSASSQTLRKTTVILIGPFILIGTTAE